MSPARTGSSVSVTRDGSFYLDRDRSSRRSSRRSCGALHEKDPEVVVVVSADGDVTHRHVVEAMDAARVAGISKMAIAVQPMEKK